MTHCDDRHQASGGSIRGIAAQGQVDVPVPIEPERLTRRRHRSGKGGGRAGRPRPRPGADRPPGLHGGGGRRPRHRPVGCGPGHARRPVRRRLLRPTRWCPAGHGARVAVGDLLGWGRFLVPPSWWPSASGMLMGRRDEPTRRRRPRRSRPGPSSGARSCLLAVAGLAALAGGSPGLGGLDRRAVVGRRLGRCRHRRPARPGARRIRRRRRTGGRGRRGPARLHRRVRADGRRRASSRAVAVARWPCRTGDAEAADGRVDERRAHRPVRTGAGRRSPAVDGRRGGRWPTSRRRGRPEVAGEDEPCRRGRRRGGRGRRAGPCCPRPPPARARASSSR